MNNKIMNNSKFIGQNLKITSQQTVSVFCHQIFSLHPARLMLVSRKPEKFNSFLCSEKFEILLAGCNQWKPKLSVGIILQIELNLSIVDQYYHNYFLQKCYEVPPFEINKMRQ